MIFLLFIHILGDVPFSKGIHRACFPIRFGKQAFLLYRPKIMAYGALMEVLQLNKHFNLQRILIGVGWM